MRDYMLKNYACCAFAVLFIISGCAFAAAGTREDPIPIGTAFELDNGWQITVLSVIANANDIVKQENMFNKDPKNGNQYFLAIIEAKNNGPDVDQFNRFYFNAVGNLSVAYEDTGAVIPDQLLSTDVFPGGIVKTSVGWEIKSEDAGSLTMYHKGVRPYVFFSLKP
jgi:hypothetical protein